MQKKTVGIIGGMGPEATVDLFRRIVAATPATCDQEHLHILIDNDPKIEDRTLAIKGDGPSPLPRILAAAQRLEQSGADVLCMPCNTAHNWHSKLQREVGIPVLHMIQLTAQAGSRIMPNAKKYGLMATTGTVEARLYQDCFEEKGLEVIVPFPTEQTELVMRAIYGKNGDGVKSGVLTGPPRERADSALASLVERGAEAVILGCTELPLLYHEGCVKNTPLINPTQILAEACVDFALGKEPE
jgi:aspartate racemase